MKFEARDQEGELAVSFELTFPTNVNLVTVIHKRIKTLLGLVGGSARFPYFDTGTTELVIPEEWLRRYSEYLETLVLNCCDFKSIDGELIRPNSPELKELKFIASKDISTDKLNMEYLNSHGFCIVGFSEDAMSPHVYTLSNMSELHRAYVFSDEGNAYVAFREVESLSIEPAVNNFFLQKDLISILEQATERKYYPRSFPNGYLTVLELFY